MDGSTIARAEKLLMDDYGLCQSCADQIVEEKLHQVFEDYKKLGIAGSDDEHRLAKDLSEHRCLMIALSCTCPGKK
ncbi:MAG: hypothetical protein KAR06_11235 [Deltaproteobacteria bacterium]|nr:hypothetical protein [Deltaproteobacteria bacterium]